MDYMEMMQSFDKVLRRSPVNTTHWHIESDRFVRMGEAVVSGYLNLNILRSIKSKEYVKSLTLGKLASIHINWPPFAEVNAYSLETKQYLALAHTGNKLVNIHGDKSPLSDSRDMQYVVFLNDVLSALFTCYKPARGQEHKIEII